MTHKSILNCSRVFTDPGTDYFVNTELTTAISDIQNNDFTIFALDTTDFKKSGYININGEKFYYSGKTKNTFNNVFRIVGPSENYKNHILNSSIKQSFVALNKLNITDTKLSGWYIDGYSNQASLRVFDAPVIQSGVIRYVEDLDNPNNSKFQGCTSFTQSGPVWQDFNATQGPEGIAGGIQTILEFNHLSDDINNNINNSGEIIKTSSLDTTTNSIIEIRRIIAGKRIINFEEIPTVDITTDNNSIIINPKSIPYTQNLTYNITQLKNGNNKAFGDTQLIYVALNTTVNNGQVVRYTTSILNNETYITVEPFIFDNNKIAQFTKFNGTNGINNNINMSIAGIALETITSTTTNLSQVLICTKGICKIKITNNFGVTAFVNTTPEISYMGRPCILNTDGYGFNTSQQVKPNSNYLEIGTFLEKGQNIASNNSFVLINLNPIFYELLNSLI